MGKFNEIQEESTQSWGGNSFTTKITDTTVEFDSAKDSFTFNDPVEVPSLSLNGSETSVFTEEEKEKLASITTAMQIKGRVDSAEDLPTEDVSVGDVYLVGASGSANFEEYLCTELSGSPEAPVWENLGHVKVQADWAETDDTKEDFIKNKPTIPDAVSVTQVQTEGTKIATVTIGSTDTDIYAPEGGGGTQADWNQTDSSADDFIKNKPIIRTGSASSTLLFTNAKVASSTDSVAFGNYTYSTGRAAFAEGMNTYAGGKASHSEGGTLNDYGNERILYCDAGGLINNTRTINGNYEDVVNMRVMATTSTNEVLPPVYITNAVYDENTNKTTLTFNQTVRDTSFYVLNFTDGDLSHVEGCCMCITGKAARGFGRFNKIEQSVNSNTYGTYVEVVGNGTDINARSNARTLDWDGNEQIAGTLRIGSTSTGGALLKFESNALKVSFDNGSTWQTVTLS